MDVDSYNRGSKIWKNGFIYSKQVTSKIKKTNQNCDFFLWTLYELPYIYIYIYPQTDCLVLSEHFSVARHAGRSKPGLKPIQLYARPSLRPTSRLRWLRELLRYLCSNSSSVRLFTFLYPISYESAHFFRRALHYASGGRQFLRQSVQSP